MLAASVARPPSDFGDLAKPQDVKGRVWLQRKTAFGLGMEVVERQVCSSDTTLDGC
jgi:hypothetical protein